MRNVPVLLLAAGLAACSIGPDYKGPPAVTAGPAGDGTFVRAADPALSAAPGLARWWEGLNDPVLNGLVDEALARSPTVDEALARIRQAQAQLRQQRGARLPSVSANATYLHAEVPGIDIGSAGGGGQDGSPAGVPGTSLDFHNLGLNASWELDLFGAGRRRIEQAQADVAAREADLADAQVSLSAQVAQAYVGLRDVQARIGLNAAATALQQRQLGLARERLAQGTASRLDIERLQAQLESTRAEAIPLGAQRDEYLNQIAVLTGRAPGALDDRLAGATPVPLPPATVPVGDPAGMIARRPDIRSAERQLAAGTAAIGLSRARELPAIRFMGLLGLGGTSPGDMFDLGNLTALAAPSLSWSFLDFGRSRAATRQSEAQRDQLEAAYRRTVLAALQDAETALSRFASTRAQLGRLARAEASATRAATLNRERVTAGTSSLIDQLDIERQRISASIAVAQAKAQLSQSYIAVNKALGLGWSAPPAPPPAPAGS